jgi:hypothetical protein
MCAGHTCTHDTFDQLHAVRVRGWDMRSAKFKACGCGSYASACMQAACRVCKLQRRAQRTALWPCSCFLMLAGESADACTMCCCAPVFWREC